MMAVRGRRVALLSACVVAALLGLAIVTETVWVRPLVKSYVHRRAGREIDFDAVRIGLDAAWRPTVSLENLTVQNASWAATTAPFIHAGEFAATFTWASLWHYPKVITRMVLRDAEVDLERQADGRRNWRLGEPEARGPGRVSVQKVDAQRTRLHVLHQGLDLDLSLDSQPVPAATASADQEIAIHGVRRGVHFDGKLVAPSLVTLYDTGEYFDARGEIDTPHARLALQGRAHDLMQLGGLDGQVKLSGDRVGELSAVLGRNPVDLPALPVTGAARLVKDQDHWSFTDLTGRFGNSDVAGSVDYRGNRAAGGRPAWRATLSSQNLDVAPWRAAAQAARQRAHAPTGPARPAPALDLDLDWKVAAFTGLPLPVGDVHAVLAGHADRWQLTSLDMGVGAGGRLSAQATLDAVSQPAIATTDLKIAHLPVGALGGSQVGGRVDAHAVLQSRGDSVAAWVAGASGDVDASLVGATLPATLEAKLGLDAGRWLGAILSDDGGRRAINCAALQVRVNDGKGEVTRLAVETDALLVNGSGGIDLAKRSIALTLTPHRRNASVLALDKSIRVDGPWGAPKVGVVSTPANSKRASCLPAVTP